EPVQLSRYVVIGAAPPGSPRDNGPVAQRYPGPFGAVVAAGGHVAVAVAEGTEAHKRRVVQGLKQCFFALGQRADHQTGHGKSFREAARSPVRFSALSRRGGSAWMSSCPRVPPPSPCRECDQSISVITRSARHRDR